MIHDNIGQFIKKFRKNEGINQTELGQQIGMTQKQVSELEAGRVRMDPEVMAVMVSAGVIPEEATQLPEQLKMATERLPFDDQMLLLEMARRLMNF